MSISLHTVTGRNKYCGPAVVSALTGVPTHVVAQGLQDEQGRYRGRGMSFTTLSHALLCLGPFKTKRLAFFADLRRAPMLGTLVDSTAGGLYRMVVATRADHFVAVADGHLADSTYRRPTAGPALAPGLRRQRVRAVWIVS
jgi:hypothetical protein